MKKAALPSYPLRALHLVAVWAYAVSQPVFSLLEANPEFLVVRGSSRLEVVVFAILLALAPPILAVGSEIAVRVASTRTADYLHLGYLGAFAAPLGLQLMKMIDASRIAAVLGAAALACLAALVYSRFRAPRLFLSFSLALPVVGFVLFVARIPVTTVNAPRVNAKIDARTPIVLIVLDELPTSSLLAADGSIDQERYPSFTRLARTGTWYPAATTVHEYTTHAVPAILDGRLPGPDVLPTLADHPRNLFTLLGESYDLRVVENTTHLCPRRYCPKVGGGSFVRRLQSLSSDVRVAYLHRILPPSLAYRLPTVDGRWGGFEDDPEPLARDSIVGAGAVHEGNRPLSDSSGRPRHDLELFLSSVRPSDLARTLHFMHVVLPHSPWRFLPSGREYGNAEAIDGSVRSSWNNWENDPWRVNQAYQRHLLQVGYTDRVLGRVLDRLERTGSYDEALVVVTADHGASFIPAGMRRLVNHENIADIARVPLLVKFPGQSRGRVDSREARSIDILPTIADVLGVRLPWTVDGRSLIGKDPKRTGGVVVMKLDGTRVEASSSEVERALDVTLRRKSAFFGEGEDSLFEIGSNLELLGRQVASVHTQRVSTSRVQFDGAELLADVRMSSSFVPARITGFIEGTEIRHDTELAVAVNGRIAALTRCFSLDGRQHFSALAPETVFRDGLNRVEVLAIEGTPSAPRLLRLGESSAEQQ